MPSLLRMGLFEALHCGCPDHWGVDCAPEYAQSGATIAIGDDDLRRVHVEKLDLSWTVAVVFTGAVIQSGARIGAHTIDNGTRCQ